MRWLVGLILSGWVLTAAAQQPSFGRQGLWERTIEEKNTYSDGKPVKDPFKNVEKGCTDNAQLKGVADPQFEDINRADPSCSYTDIKTSGNTLSWSYRCGEAPKRNGRSSGRVHHQYDSAADTVVQQYSFSIDFPVSNGRWSNVKGETQIVARRLGDCRPAARVHPRLRPPKNPK
jgi:hypothetical protein